MRVSAGGPADGALVPGDEIVAVDGVDCRSFANPSRLRDALVGQEVRPQTSDLASTMLVISHALPRWPIKAVAIRR